MPNPPDRPGPARFATLTDQGRVRPGNQDEARAIALPDGTVLLLVADGLGGEPAGDLASAEAAESVLLHLARGAPFPSTDLAEAFFTANARVKSLARQDPRRATMATTLTVAAIRGGECWLANAGDSRAYVITAAAITQLTRDDSWVAERVRAGDMSSEDAEVHPYRNVVTRGVGIDDELFADVALHSVGDGDAVLLCTDGLYRMLTDSEIASLVRQAKPPLELVHQLVAAANAAGGVDNIGVALYVAAQTI